MGATIAQVASGLKPQFAPVTGLRAYDYVPEDINPPCAIVQLVDIDRGAFVRGMMELRFDVTVLVQKASDRAGQSNIYSFADSASVWNTLGANKVLGLSGVDAATIHFRALGMDEVAAYGYYGGTFEFLVL